MKNPSRWRHRLCNRITRGLGIAVTFSLAPWSLAADQPPPSPAAAVAPVAVFHLADCLSLALERQPAIAAQRASLAAAETGWRSAENIKIPAFIVHDLPARRKQAALGVQIHTAGLDLAEREAIYNVTRTYYTVLFARAQERVARSAVDSLKISQVLAKAKAAREERGGVTPEDVDKITIYLRLAETRQIQAAEGVDRALAALREAMGVGYDFPLRVPDEALTEKRVQISREEVIRLALSRRGELVQTAALAEVTALEIEAQSSSCRPRMATYAAYADLHSQPVPQGINDGEYRPGAVGPEMPTELVGSKATRVELAGAFGARMQAIVEKTRNLIALEAEDAFRRWHEASQKLRQTSEAAAKAVGLDEKTRTAFTGDQKIRVEDLLGNIVLSGLAQGQHNETLFQQLLALAALERVTAGGLK